MSTAAQVVSIALAEVGYHEKASNASLDLTNGNNGSGNWTKYARDLWEAKYYNGDKNGYAWCDVFVDWVFFKAFGKTEGQLIECQTGTLGAACPYSAGYYKAQGRYDTTPRVGDQVFFQQGGELVHTGIVVEVTAGQVVTVEGNSSDQVKKNTYSRSSTYIAGYGHPKYDESSSGGDTPAPAPAPAVDLTEKVKEWQEFLGVDPDGDPGQDTEIAALKKMLIAMLTKHPLTKGATGDAVTVLQGLLYAAGYDANGLDGDYGSGCAAAVRAFEQAVGQTQDGSAGKSVVSALLDKVFG